MTNLRLVQPKDLVLNEPLPWTLYDAHGNLLLRQGYVLNLPRHIDSLLARGAYVEEVVVDDEEDAAPAEDMSSPLGQEEVQALHDTESVFSRALRLADSLERFHADLQSGQIRPGMHMRIMGMAYVMEQACAQDADALLAALHVNRQHPYLVVHQLLGAAITAIVVSESKLNDATRTSWVCAALTRDIGLVEIQPQLDQQNEALSGEQTMMVHHHPVYALDLLEQMGVRDPVWLQVVREHQERCDGSGYPQGLAGDGMHEGAKLLTVADSYAAMVTPRPNRSPRLPHEAMKDLYAARDGAYDAQWVAAVIKALTMFPPGSIVQLASGERAVVRARASSLQTLQTWSVCDEQGTLLMPPIPRSAADPAHAIQRAVPLSTLGSHSHCVAQLW